MTRLMLGLTCLAILTGCSAVQRINPFGAVPEVPLPFTAKVRATRNNPDFGVDVVSGGAGIEAWRESARFVATRHCLLKFGSSDIDWQSTGAPDNWVVARQTNGNAQLRGRCTAR